MLDYIKAKYPLLWVQTCEPDRFIGQLVSGPVADIRSIGIWDCKRGFRIFNEKAWSDFTPIDVADPFEMPDIMAKYEKTVWVLLNYHWFLDQPPTIQGLLNRLGIYKARSVTVMIVSPEARVNAQMGIPREIDREVVVVDYKLPNRQELAEVLDDVFTENTIPPYNKEAVLDAGQGLTWGEFENAAALSLVKEKRFDPKIISQLKAQMVEKNPALEFSRYTETFDSLGGLENLKRWTKNRFDNRRPGLPFRGIMLLGVPGTGKSHFAKSLANEVGWPCLTFRLSAIFGSLVGESESQAREALKVVDAMSPCVLYIDEVDKGLAGVGGGSSDGGTTQRVGGIFLSWMQDRMSEVFVIATANDITALPTEYKRTGGRWDAIFFVDIPNLEERKAIIDVYLETFKIKGEEREEALRRLPELLDGYTGAEIRQVIIEMAYNGGKVKEAADFVIPLIRSEATKIELLREQAKSWQMASKKVSETWEVKPKRRVMDG